LLCLAKQLLLLFCLVKKEAKKTTTHIKFQFGISHRPALHRRQKEIFTSRFSSGWTQRARLALNYSCGLENIKGFSSCFFGLFSHQYTAKMNFLSPDSHHYTFFPTKSSF